MGVFAKAWVPNKLDLESIRGLATTLNAACPCCELWVWAPEEQQDAKPWIWDGWPSEEYLDGECAIFGGGSSVRIYRDVLVVGSPLRWRGFIGYPDLRHRARAVASRIVRALGATEIVWLPDWFLNDWPDGEAVSFDGVRRHLLAGWGAPQPSLDPIEDSVVRLAEHSSPKVWFQESIL
jgi:hypothetical protein